MFKLSTVIWVFLSGTSLAQNSTTNSSLPKDCPSGIRDVDKGFLMYNSTGTLPVKFEGQYDPWYVTLTVTDHRAPYLVFGDIDTFQERNIFRNLRTPGFLDHEAVNARRFTSVKNASPTSIADKNLSSTRCALDEMPHIDLPKDYKTLDAMLSGGPSGGPSQSDRYREDFDVYDLVVQQPVPIMFSVQNSQGLGETCPTAIRNIGDDRLMYNSTRTLPVTSKGQEDPFLITAAITDQRGPSTEYQMTYGPFNSRQDLSVFVSVPGQLTRSRGAKDTQICLYMMRGLNKTSGNPTDSERSCDRVVSDECIEEFEQTPMAAEDKCPQLEVKEKCEKQVWLKQIEPFNLTDGRCSLDAMPYLDIPEDYRTYGSSLFVGLDGSKDRDDFYTYDLRVQQSIPLLFTVRNSDGDGESKMVCISPDQPVRGSREAEMELPKGDDDDEEEEEE
ncbi:hypothetical protein FBEOM_13304, partial [Fusarium beomiforme]